MLISYFSTYTVFLYLFFIHSLIFLFPRTRKLKEISKKKMAEFLKECARRLDEGVAAEKVLESMRERYTTPGCMKVKTCIVRRLCNADPQFDQALKTAIARVHPDLESPRRLALCELVRRAAWQGKFVTGDIEADQILKAMPPYLPRNVRDLHVTPSEIRECKKRARVSRLVKNHERVVVDGCVLLSKARHDLRHATTLSDLALSLMLLTGRRQCEILSGQSTFEAMDTTPFAARFTGQAKRRGLRTYEALQTKTDDQQTKADDHQTKSDEICYVIPLLDDFFTIWQGYQRLRALQEGKVLDRDQTSRKYQSLLSRRLHEVFPDAKHPHGLRGVYACMALRAFTWGDMSDSFVTMCILGHRDLDESLVYTTFDVGESFVTCHGKSLGTGHLTPRLT